MRCAHGLGRNEVGDFGCAICDVTESLDDAIAHGIEVRALIREYGSDTMLEFDDGTIWRIGDFLPMARTLTHRAGALFDRIVYGERPPGRPRVH